MTRTILEFLRNGGRVEMDYDATVRAYHFRAIYGMKVSERYCSEGFSGDERSVLDSMIDAVTNDHPDCKELA